MDLNGLRELFLPLIAFLLALLFYYTSKSEKCWYRKYITPAILVIVALSQLKNPLNAALYLMTAVLIGLGFKGYGRKKLEEEKEEKESEKNEDSD